MVVVCHLAGESRHGEGEAGVQGAEAQGEEARQVAEEGGVPWRNASNRARTQHCWMQTGQETTVGVGTRPGASGVVVDVDMDGPAGQIPDLS